jgi:hypothetical protein
MTVNTKDMTEDELKATLKDRSRAERIDLADPKNAYTIWSENGVWSEDGKHLTHEASAAHMSEKERKVRECILKTSYSRTMILDAVQDGVEIVLPDGKVTVAVPR